MEFQDWETRLHSEDESTKGTNIEKYYDTMIPAFEKAGYEANPGPKLEDWFREVGFEGVQVKRYQVPLGGWPKDGHMVCTIYLFIYFTMVSQTFAHAGNLQPPRKR